jgi:predicted tellurium resistance membrane protein TerC
MVSPLLDPAFWLSLFSVTLVQVALGADNLIIITIIANKLPATQQKRAIRLGLVLAMAFRILLLGVISFVLRYATGFSPYSTTTCSGGCTCAPRGAASP